MRAPSLSQLPWLVHGFSTRTGGVSKVYGGKSLNLGFTEADSRSAVERNRQAFSDALVRDVLGRTTRPSKRETSPLVAVRQIHSDIIHCVADLPKKPLAGDGLITNTPGILLAVLAADCLPVILVDTKRHAVGVFHAGWRGTIQRIVEKGVGEMRKNFGTRPSDLKVAIGPGIRGCCCQVGPEVKDVFESQFSYAVELFRETKDRDEIHERYPLLFLTSRAPGHSELPKQIFLDLGEGPRQIKDEELPDRLAGIYANRTKDKILFLKADQNLDFGRVQQAIEIARQAGARVVGAITEQKQSLTKKKEGG